MDRRFFFKGLALGCGYSALSSSALAQAVPQASSGELSERMLEKIKNFDADFPEDVHFKDGEEALVRQVLSRIARIKDRVGFGNFNLLSFDELLKTAAADARIGAFTREEVAYIEQIFFGDATAYGFFGEKVSPSLTGTIAKRSTTKIPGSGHYLFRGKPVTLYEKLKKDIGHDIQLTSGIRSVVKQLDLFLTKALICQGNLSRASRSLAPPGYSFHGVSDFDVGKAGLGPLNFTDSFAATDVYKRLTDLGYVDIRYTEINPFGVRFEPWHIKV